MKVIVRQRQTLSDIALQIYGVLSGVIVIARQNDLAVTDELTAGMVLECPDLTFDNYLQNYVRKNGIVPATEYDGEGEIPQRIFTEEFTEEFV